MSSAPQSIIITSNRTALLGWFLRACAMLFLAMSTPATCTLPECAPPDEASPFRWAWRCAMMAVVSPPWHPISRTRSDAPTSHLAHQQTPLSRSGWWLLR